MRDVLRVTGSPAPRISGRDLPPWLSLTDHHDGTATLVAVNPPDGTIQLVVHAGNRGGQIDQPLFLIVKDQQAPIFVTPDTRTCYLAAPCNVPIRVTGWPTPVITERGLLPSGVSFARTAKGAVLHGKVRSSAAPGSYRVSLQASTGLGSPAIQTFTLSVR